MTTCSRNIGHHVDTGSLWCHGTKDKPCEWSGKVNETIEAANRLLDFGNYIYWDGNDAYHRPEGDAGLVARAYLAEHRDDDEQIASVDWLSGLTREGGDMSFMAMRCVDRELHLISHDYVSPRPITKGAVRMLCRALGVELKEQI